MALDLRPLTLGELLDRSFGLYRRHFWLFVGLMALPSVIVVVLNVAVLLVPEFVDQPGTPGAIQNPDTLVLIFLVGGFAFFLLMAGYAVAYMVTLGASTVAVSEVYVGRTATIASAYSHVRGHIGRLTLLMILIGLRLLGIFLGITLVVALFAMAAAFALGSRSAGIAAPVAAGIVVLGMLGAMLIAFLFSLRYSVAVPALVLEPVTASEAIRRSVLLTRDNLWRTGVIVVFAIFISTAALAIFQMPFVIGAEIAGAETSTAFWLNLAGSVSAAFGSAVTTPLMIVALALLYYDLRIRKEGLDVQIMMASLDQHTPPGTSGALSSAS